MITVSYRIDPECFKQLKDDFDLEVSGLQDQGFRIINAGMTDLYIWAMLDKEVN